MFGRDHFIIKQTICNQYLRAEFFRICPGFCIIPKKHDIRYDNLCTYIQYLNNYNNNICEYSLESTSLFSYMKTRVSIPNFNIIKLQETLDMIYNENPLTCVNIIKEEDNSISLVYCIGTEVSLFYRFGEAQTSYNINLFLPKYLLIALELNIPKYSADKQNIIPNIVLNDYVLRAASLKYYNNDVQTYIIDDDNIVHSIAKDGITILKAAIISSDMRHVAYFLYARKSDDKYIDYLPLYKYQCNNNLIPDI